MGGFLTKDVDLVVPETVELQRFKPGDPSFVASSKRAIKEGGEEFESVTDFIGRINEFNADTELSLQEKSLKGFTALQQKLVAQATADITDPFNLPEGVRDLLQTEAAQRGVSTGVSLRDEAGQTGLLKDFGLKALDIGQQRIQRSQSLFRDLVAASPTASAVSPFQFLQTGQQAAQEDVQQSRLEFEADKEFKIRSQQIQQDAANVRAAIANQEQISNQGTFLGDVLNVGTSLATTAFAGQQAFGRGGRTATT